MGAWGLIGKGVASLLGLGSGWLLCALLARRIGRNLALVVMLAFWLGTPLWPTTVDYLQHHPTIFFQLAGLLALFGCTQSSNPRFLPAGLCLGMAVLARYQVLPAVAATVPAVLWLWRGNRRRWGYLLGLALMTLPAMAYQKAVFGGYLQRGPMVWLNFDYPAWLGLAGLLVNPSKGLWIHSPWLLAGWALLCRLGKAQPLDAGDTDQRRLVWIALALVLPTVALYAPLNGWYGGWSWGYRYLMDALPGLSALAGLGLAVLWPRRPARWIACAAMGLSGLIQTIGALAYDGGWHKLHDLGGGPSQRWLWQVRNSQIPFLARRGVVYLGRSRHALWSNPYATQGVYPPESWQGQPMAWTEPTAHWLFVARTPEPLLRLTLPPANGTNQTYRVTLHVQGGAVLLAAVPAGGDCEWTLPIPWQASRVLTLQVTPGWQEPGPGRRLGAAIPEAVVTRTAN
jgi:hypothetical protein